MMIGIEVFLIIGSISGGIFNLWAALTHPDGTYYTGHCVLS